MSMNDEYAPDTAEGYPQTGEPTEFTVRRRELSELSQCFERDSRRYDQSFDI